MLQIKRFSPTSHKIKAVVYGESGTGKTTLGGTCPNPIFASAEKGLLSIKHLEPEYVDIKELKDLADMLVFLRKGEHNYDTVVIDSITEISEIIKVGIERKSGKAMSLPDFGTLGKKIREIIRGFRDLDMHVLILALEKVEKDEDKVVRYVPDLAGKSGTELARFMDIVGWITVDPVTNQRHIITSTNAKTVSKDRTNMIGNNTEPDFNAWIEAVKGVVVTKEEKIIYQEEIDSEEEEEVRKPLPTAKAAPKKVVEKPVEAVPPAVEQTNEEIVKEIIEEIKVEEEATETMTEEQVDAGQFPDAPTEEAPIVEEIPVVAAPEKPVVGPITEPQTGMIRGYLSQLTAGLDEATIAQKLRGSIKAASELVIPKGIENIDAILGMMNRQQAAKVIAFLKEKAAALAPVAPVSEDDAEEVFGTPETVSRKPETFREKAMETIEKKADAKAAAWTPTPPEGPKMVPPAARKTSEQMAAELDAMK